MFSPTLIFLLISLIAYVAESVDEELPTYTCDSSSYCTLKGLRLSKDQPYFNIKVDQPEEVISVTLQDCVIPVLSNSICKTFPALQSLDARECQIEIINEDAFNECPEITLIMLPNNKIKRLHVNTFRNNNKLETLELGSNRIKCIEEGTFNNLPDLRYFTLGNNKLTEFSPKLIEESKNLTFLEIYSNNLSDFDLEMLHEMIPDLKHIILNKNEFSCVRAEEMFELALEKDIQLSMKRAPERTRYYDIIMYEVYGTPFFPCLGDVAWAANHYRKQIQKSC